MEEEGVLRLQEQQEQRSRELSVIDARYLLEGETYNRERIEAEIALHGQIIGEQFYHIGRKLLLLKEHEGYGYFGQALERLGINKRTAQAWMRASITVDKLKSAESAHLGRQKLLELSFLSDEELEALGEGRTVAGLVLDELDKMSYSELKTQVRGHKAELASQAEAYDAVFAQKDKALNEKDQEILRLQKELAAPSAKERENRRRKEMERVLLEMCAEGHSAERALRSYLRLMEMLCALEGISPAELEERQDEMRLHLEGVGDALKACAQFVPLLAPEREAFPARESK